MSMITPPGALAAFAAAAISKAGPFATGMAAMRFGWAAFILPFAFVATPALLFDGTLTEVLTAAALTAAGVAGVTAGIAGYWARRLGPGLRLAFVALGALALPLGFIDIGTGPHIVAALAIGLLATALAVQKVKARATNQPT
jgi:TRAP-type uncharacterized transport system fused permease subunit